MTSLEDLKFSLTKIIMMDLLDCRPEGFPGDINVSELVEEDGTLVIKIYYDGLMVSKHGINSHKAGINSSHVSNSFWKRVGLGKTYDLTLDECWLPE
jgi:hypothetical protein